LLWLIGVFAFHVYLFFRVLYSPFSLGRRGQGDEAFSGG
jgi:hypothetical protein